MEPSEAQYLILNALETLGLLGNSDYNENTGIWSIETPSPISPNAQILPNGDIEPSTRESELLVSQATEEQYLILKALKTLDLLPNALYDREEKFWLIDTPSPVLPYALLWQNGEIVPMNW